MKTVVIVDDNKVDRYTIRRRLSKLDNIGEVLEFDAGDTFVHSFFSEAHRNLGPDGQLIVIMDINMPRMTGFETVAEMERQIQSGGGVESCVVMMFSSSDNPSDREMAAGFEIVKTYIVKPFDQSDVAKLKSLIEEDA